MAQNRPSAWVSPEVGDLNLMEPEDKCGPFTNPDQLSDIKLDGPRMM